jgi:hypothetical protein
VTNEERRRALAVARRKALTYANEADLLAGVGEYNTVELNAAIKVANMWANVAAAMKVGQALEADGVIPEPTTDPVHMPIGPIHITDGLETR